jgi:hypothetical protein
LRSSRAVAEALFLQVSGSTLDGVIKGDFGQRCWLNSGKEALLVDGEVEGSITLHGQRLTVRPNVISLV